MYTVRISHVPAPGKGPALRAALEEHSKASNAAGGRYSVSQRLFSPENVFVNTYWVENLAALEAYNASSINDAARMARLAKITELVSRPQALELSEVLVPARPTAEVNYTLHTTLYAAVGKGPELQAFLEKAVTAPIQGRVGAALRTVVVSTEGPSFTIVGQFSSLAGLEEFRAAFRSRPDARERGAALVALTARPQSQELYRTLMRLPQP